MLPLDDPRWPTLVGGYQVPYDPRPALERLRSDAGAADAWAELWNELHHQGDVGTASYAAVPHLVAIHRDRDQPDWNAYSLVSLIEEIRLEKGPALPDWLSESYHEAIARLGELAIQDLERSEDPLVVRGALQAVALAKGLRQVARIVGRYSDDELRELEARYNEQPAAGPTAVIAAFNAWLQNDLDLPPAAFAGTTVESLPDTPRDLVALLPEPHRTFMRDACGPGYETLTFGAPQPTTSFDPTADILPAASNTPGGREAHAQVARYFRGRPITYLEVTGNDSAQDLLINLQIAHDPQGSLLFTFLRVSD